MRTRRKEIPKKSWLFLLPKLTDEAAAKGISEDYFTHSFSPIKAYLEKLHNASKSKKISVKLSYYQIEASDKAQYPIKTPNNAECYEKIYFVIDRDCFLGEFDSVVDVSNKHKGKISTDIISNGSFVVWIQLHKCYVVIEHKDLDEYSQWLKACADTTTNINKNTVSQAFDHAENIRKLNDDPLVFPYTNADKCLKSLYISAGLFTDAAPSNSKSPEIKASETLPKRPL